MLDSKKQLLIITLTEPVVFLRSSDPSGRLRPGPSDPPTLVRGILVLNVVKPITITAIEVELTGVLTLNPPQAIGPRQILEKQTVYSSSLTLFRADQAHERRHASVGPGLSTANLSNDNEHARITLPYPPLLSRRRSERPVSVPANLGPTPPYTYVAHSPPPIHSRPDVPGENTAMLEELSRTPSSRPEDQVQRSKCVSPPSRPHSIGFLPPNPTTQHSLFCTLDDSLHRENGNHTDGVAQTYPPFADNASFRNTTEESSHGDHFPSQLSPSYSSGSAHGTQPGRPRPHLPLNSVLDIITGDTPRSPSESRGVTEERERGRARVRLVAEDQRRESNLDVGESVGSTGNGNQSEANSSYSNGHTERRENLLLGLGRVLGLENGQEREKSGEQKPKEHGQTWKEFKPGTYSYPISFLLPPTLPPTLSVPHGSFDYVIKAVAHRPGTFTSKLSCQTTLTVIAAPAGGEGSGDPGPLIFQRQWGEKLACSFGLSSRLFLLGNGSQCHLKTTVSEGICANIESQIETGLEARAEAAYGTVTLDFTLLPLEKVKIWTLNVFVDQCITYDDEKGLLSRNDRRQVKLLDVRDAYPAEETDPVGKEEQTRKNNHRNGDDLTPIPLLPTPVSPHRSPLLRLIPPSTDPSILAGPGPYTLSTSIRLPDCAGHLDGTCGLHFTVKQRSSGVKVEHVLAVIMRVECVGEQVPNDDHSVDKTRLFDVSLRTPITILSCRCAPEYHTLPRYSQVTQDSCQNLAPCQGVVSSTERSGHVHRHHHHGSEDGDSNNVGHDTTSYSTSSFESENRGCDGDESGHRSHSRSSSFPATTHHSNLPPSSSWQRFSAHFHGPHYRPHNTHPGRHSHPQTPASTPYPSRPPSPSPPMRYERLVSGLESDSGDVPPAYESIDSSL